MVKNIRQTLGRLLACLLLPMVIGCSDMQRAITYGKRNDVEQSQAVDWGPLFKIKIVKCSWDGPNLAVDISMTYSGSEPAVPTQVPVFRLESSDGKHFVPSDGAEATMELITQPYNPGLSRDVRLSFPAPRFDYTLRVEDGGIRPDTVGIYPSAGVLVYVWHIHPTGG